MNDKIEERIDAPVERYAVLLEGKKVATVSVLGEGTDLRFNLDAETAEMLEQLRGVLSGDEAKADEAKAKVDEEEVPTAQPKKRQPTREDVVRAVVRKIESLGFDVQQLPSSDVQFQMEISADTGRRVAVTSQLHEFAEPRGMGKVLFDALANVGSTARATMAQKITDGLATGDAEAAAQALIEWAGVGFLFGVTEADLEHARRVPIESFSAVLREKSCLFASPSQGSSTTWATRRSTNSEQRSTSLVRLWMWPSVLSLLVSKVQWHEPRATQPPQSVIGRLL